MKRQDTDEQETTVENSAGAPAIPGDTTETVEPAETPGSPQGEESQPAETPPLDASPNDGCK